MDFWTIGGAERAGLCVALGAGVLRALCRWAGGGGGGEGFLFGGGGGILCRLETYKNKKHKYLTFNFMMRKILGLN